MKNLFTNFLNWLYNQSPCWLVAALYLSFAVWVGYMLYEESRTPKKGKVHYEHSIKNSGGH